MQKNDYPHIRETVYQTTLPNGLRVQVVPKKGFSKVYSTFATSFGSFATAFKVNGIAQTLPFGVAHFLEHQLFESADGVDVTSQFALLGADCNAYTDYQETAYIAISTSRHAEVIELLLNYVQHPQFTPNSVREEQGIIEQERSMYLDRASVRAQMGLLKNMYAVHPIREDIVGTKESIQAITYADLRQAYDTFYHPSNMILVIVGDVEVNEVIALVEANQAKKTFLTAPILDMTIPVEVNEVVCAFGEDKMDIIMPKAVMGIKLLPIATFGLSNFQVEVMLRMILEEHFGLSSPSYQFMLDHELINTHFSFNFYLDHAVGYIYLSANTIKPQEFLAYIQKQVLLIPSHEMDSESFECLHRATHGSLIKSLNSLETIAHNIVEYSLAGDDFFSIFDAIRDLKKQDIHRFDGAFTPLAISQFIINSSKQ